MNSRLVDIAAPLELSGIFATVDSEGTAAVWSVSEHRQLASFNVAHDFGGRRLALTDDRLVVGRYHRDGKILSGVRAYDFSGALIWERTDLKQPQRLSPLPDGHVAVGLGYSSLNVVDRDGRTVRRIRAASSINASTMTDTVLANGSPSWVALHENAVDGARRWKRRIESFAILDAALTGTDVAVSEAGGNVRAFSLEGEERWTWSPPRGQHVLALGWAGRRECWAAILFPYERVEPSTLMTITNRGEVLREKHVVRSDRVCFLEGGELLVNGANGSFEVLHVPDATVEWSPK